MKRKLILTTLFLCTVFFFFTNETHAAVPTITGRVINQETGAPIAGVWVSMTGSGCPSCPTCQIDPPNKTKYEQTDANGNFRFVSIASKDWKDADGNLGGFCGHPWIGQPIDTNLDGVVDAERIPSLSCTFSETDSSGNPVTFNVCSPDFGCTSADYSFTVVMPDGWGGSFDTIDGINFSNIPAVVDMPIGDIYYHPPTEPNTPPEVQITFPNSFTGVLGVSLNIIAQATDAEDGAADTVAFYDNDDLIGIDDTPDAGNYFTQNWTPTTLGPHTIRVVATDSDGATGEDSIGHTIVTVDPWWQLIGGGAHSRGDIVSKIPTTCTSPGCINALIRPDAFGKNSAAIASGNVDFSNSPSTGQVSPAGEWLVNSPLVTNTYTYEYFSSLAEGRTFHIAGPNINTGDVNQAPVAPEIYNWVRVSGNANINQPLNVNRKAVVFVDGNLNINNRIRINNSSDDFIMFVVGGDINVSASLSSSGANDPAIQGVFYADGSFNTLSDGDDERIVIEGIVSASDINLGRDLGADNLNTPAELFVFEPAFVVNFPSALSIKHLIWREIEP